MASISERVSEFVKGLVDDPAALSAIKAGLAQLPPAPPKSRDVMPAEERKARALEVRRRQAAFASKKAEADAKATEARRRIQADQELLARIGLDMAAEADAYCAWRDSQMERLWSERPGLVDELVDLCTREAHGLRAESRTKLPNANRWGGPLFGGRPTDGVMMNASEEAKALSMGVVTMSNRASVEARQKALHGLAADINEWTIQGAYATEGELRAMFDKAYRSLPAVEALAA